MSTPSSAKECARLLKAEVDIKVIMDIAMPFLNCTETTRQIVAAAPPTRVLILSDHFDDAYQEHVMACGAAG